MDQFYLRIGFIELVLLFLTGCFDGFDSFSCCLAVMEVVFDL